MSEIKLFQLTQGVAQELQGVSSDLEKPLQTLIERNLEALLGVRFLATEYSTGKTHGGRIDSLGLDEDNCPVIIEYKRSLGENVINQGLFYLDWLLDHQAEFKLLVQEKCGPEEAGIIDWSEPRLVCIAAEFTKYDAHAIQMISRNIDLIRYRQFGPDLLLLELANARSASTGRASSRIGGALAKPVAESSTRLQDLFASLESYVMSLGDDVQRKDLKQYIAFKRIRNFCSVRQQKDRLLVELHISPQSVQVEEGYLRLVTNAVHGAEVLVYDHAGLERAKPLILQSYEGGPGAS